MRVITGKNSYFNNGYWYFFTIAYAFFEYVRPQDFVQIGFLKPVLTVIIILSYFILANRGIAKANSDQTRMILYFILLLAIYIPFARNNYYALATTNNMIAFVPFIISFINCVDTIERLKKTVYFFIAILSFVSIYSIFNKGVGTGNFLKDENDLALYINTWLPFSYFLMLEEKGFRQKIFCAFALITGLIGIVFSFSRGGFIGLISILIIAFIFSKKKGVSIIVIVLLGGIIYFYAGDKYLDEMSTITDTSESTASERISSWKAAIDIFLDMPWGVGGNNYQVWFPHYQPPEIKKNMWGRVAHSIWFTLIPELGAIGIIIYSRLIFFNVRDILQISRFHNKCNKLDSQFLQTLSRAFIASMVGYFSSGSFLSALYYPHFWYITVMIVVAKRLGTLAYSGECSINLDNYKK